MGTEESSLVRPPSDLDKAIKAFRAVQQYQQDWKAYGVDRVFLHFDEVEGDWLDEFDQDALTGAISYLASNIHQVYLRIKSMETLLAVIVALIVGLPVILLLLVSATLINGYTLHLLWLWFMVPILNLPPLTIGQAIAVSMVINFITYQYYSSPKETKENEWIIGLLQIFVRPLLVLGIAQIVRNFI